MLFARSQQQVDQARGVIARIGKLSDNIVGFGPFGIGIDGILAWVPGLGDVYSVIAGGMLIVFGLRARAPVATLVQVGLLIGLRSTIGAAAIPFLGPLYPISGALVDLFRGHKMSADLLVKAIDNTYYAPGSSRDVQSDPRVAEGIASARAKGSRIVHLG